MAMKPEKQTPLFTLCALRHGSFFVISSLLPPLSSFHFPDILHKSQTISKKWNPWNLL